MTSLLEPRANPLVACLAVLDEALDDASAANPSYLSLEEKESVMAGLARVRERVDGLLLGVMAASDDVAAEHGSRSVADWLAHRTRSDYGPTARHWRLAQALDHRWSGVASALIEGRASMAQAEVIAAALDALPEVVEPAIRIKAEAHLVDQAAHYTPRQLRVLGRKVLEVVAPDAFDDEERRLLEAEEAAARRRSFLRFRMNGDGTTDVRARVSDAVAERLRTYLEALSAPRRLGSPAVPERRPLTQRWGEAFGALLERLPADLLPQHGGSATTLVVTIDINQLRDGLGSAELAGGGRISAGEARRLACMASILPAVLDGPSAPLDLGRASRLFTGAQRLALTIRDRECRAEGCTIPAAWCEAHHLTETWAAGGRTDLADGALLCSHHHHRIHDPAYRHELRPDGAIRFHRRT
jgi:hypothetical protein